MSKVEIELLSDRQQNPAYVYLSSLASPVSRKTMGSALGVIARKLGAANAFEVHWEEIRYPQLVAIQTWLANTHSAAATRRYVSSVRGVLKCCWRMSLIDTDSYIRTIDLTPVHGNTKKGNYAGPDELAALYATCRSGSPVRGARDEAILRLSFGLGLRVSEVMLADLADFDRNSSSLLIHGKGRKLRVVYVFGSIREALDRWLKLRGEHVGALFEVVDWYDTITHKPITTPVSIWEMYNKRCRWAGIRHLAPHDARRTACSNLLGVTDSLTVARILGHASLSITAIYDRRNESAAREACEKAGEVQA